MGSLLVLSQIFYRNIKCVWSTNVHSFFSSADHETSELQKKNDGQSTIMPDYAAGLLAPGLEVICHLLFHQLEFRIGDFLLGFYNKHN